MTTSTMPEASTSERRRAVWGATAGTVAEGYDWIVYGTFTGIVAPVLFFPSADPTVAVLASVATFGVAFVTRPIGAALFGNLGDRVGRRNVLVWTLALMGLTSLGIGLLPGYAVIGPLAPVLLVTLRLLQGLSYGGEWGGATLMAVESSSRRSGGAGRERRGLYGGAVQAALLCGSVLSTITLLFVGRLPDDQLFSWGWRVPFVLGAVLTLVGFVIRWSVRESPDFVEVKQQDRLVRVPIVAAFRQYPGSIALIALSYVAGGSVFYAAVIFGQTYGLRTLGFTRNEMTVLLLVLALTMVAAIPLFGMLSDVVGHKRVVLGGVVAMAVTVVPWILLFGTRNYLLAGLGYVLLGIAISANYGPLGTLFSRCFPVEVRYSGISIGYQLGTVLGGAVPPLVAVAILAATGSVVGVIIYLLATMVVSFVATWFLRTDESDPVDRRQLVGATAGADA